MKDNTVYLQHIFESIEKIQGYLQSVDEEIFMKDEMRFSATVRQLQIIGEATTKINPAFKNDHTEIPWRKMVSMRNFLVHEYFGVNDKTVWDTCQEDLPGLKTQIDKLIKSL